MSVLKLIFIFRKRIHSVDIYKNHTFQRERKRERERERERDDDDDDDDDDDV